MATTTTTTTAAAASAAAHDAVRVRPARLSDAAAIAKLGAHVFSVTFGHSVTADELQAYLDKEYTHAAITADLQNPQKDTILAVDAAGEVLGFAVLTRGSSEPCVEQLESKVELQRIYVHPDAHGKGVGGRLGRRVEEMAREQGFRWMWLGVWEENFVAQKAYEKWGYEKVGEHDFVVGSVVQTDWIMTKEL
ncbi:Spermidine/spermine N(1)-acetyltransferase [Lasiodiplodia hormozganensis]|uniref:Spermidine/spermine N(1)-acetyltransferase n=1 Tax=Lasiodiplodia hormozganensis TaxID=869390 RepID=A0AA40CSX1_9PEZI|nr:Spermidine/spermine N(1)-acetyltransferase [Lasiodiplodia hormozganensis]